MSHNTKYIFPFFKLHIVTLKGLCNNSFIFQESDNTLGGQTSAHVCQIFCFILKHFGKQIPHFLSVSSSEHTLVHVQSRIQRNRTACVRDKSNICIFLLNIWRNYLGHLKFFCFNFQIRGGRALQIIEIPYKDCSSTICWSA